MTPRAWTRQVSNDYGSVTIMPSEAVGGICPTWEDLGNVLHTALIAATETAPKMVMAAMTALSAQKEAIKKGGPDLDRSAAGVGLMKYFNLDAGAVSKLRYLQTIDGITRVYGKIMTGFTLYDLVVDSGDSDGLKGWVMRKGAMTKVDTPSIAKNYSFAFGSDSECVYGAGFERERAGRIHMDMTTLMRTYTAKAKKDMARVLVHEASHKWAYATDVLYKVQTFMKGGLVDFTANETSAIMEYQPMIDLPGKQKTLLPMTGFEKLDPKKHGLKNNLSCDLIQPERWLQNADSYAWFARSMLKDYFEA